jgi:hypothetical protein
MENATNLCKMAEKVDSKESFLLFVQALAEDAAASDAPFLDLARGAKLDGCYKGDR